MDENFQETRKKKRDEDLEYRREIRHNPELRRQQAKRGLGTNRRSPMSAGQQNQKPSKEKSDVVTPPQPPASPSPTNYYCFLPQDILEISPEARTRFKEATTVQR